jgi:MYXO-CTERM domain-containing protein
VSANTLERATRRGWPEEPLARACSRGRAVTAALAALLVGPSAWAGWTMPSGTTGTPLDVNVASAGQLVVVTTQGAYEIGGISRQLAGTLLRSGFIDDAGCFRVISASGFLGSVGGCGTDFATPLRNEVQRLRLSPGGHVWGCSRDVNLDVYAFSNNAGKTQLSWAPIESPGACGGALSVLSASAGEYALFTVTGALNNVALYRDGTLETRASTIAGVGVAPLSVQLVGGVGVPLRAFAVASTGGLEVAVVDGVFQSFSSIPLPAGVARFQSVALHHSGTERFGVALVELTGGSFRVLSAVPDPSPATFGHAWRESTAPPSGAVGAWKDVQCLAAAACGAITAGTGPGSVLSYVNASAPSPPAASAARVPAGGSVTVPVISSDPDGDAVWVSWRQTSPASPLLAVATQEDGTSLIVGAPTEPLCESSMPFTLELRAEDGRAGHVSAPTSLEITVEGTPPAVGTIRGAPLLARCEDVAGQPTVVAGGDLTHIAPPDACPTQTVSWSQVAGPTALAGTVQGTAISLRAEGAAWDDLVGRTVSLELVASGGTVSSSSAVRDVAIAPERPFVRAAIATDAPVVSELGVLGISVTLLNESGCGVRGATVAAVLDGAYLVPGSLQLDGAAIDGGAAANAIAVSPLDLPPGVARVLHFEVRPALVGSVSPRAVAMLGGVPISDAVGLGNRPEITGCGCASGGESLAGWTLLAVLALWRRRQIPKEMRRPRVSARRSSIRRSSSNP